MTASAQAFLDSLSQEQREAALATSNPVMTIAGAGSGKTRTLVGRFLHLVLPRAMGGLGADPGSIMMVTFTNKAAREMRERIDPVLEELRQTNPDLRGEPWIGTFHALSLRILRIEASRSGLGRNFSIFDEADASALVQDVVTGLKVLTFDEGTFFRDLEFAKARLIEPGILCTKAREIEAWRTAQPTAPARGAEVLPPGLRLWGSLLDGFDTPRFPEIYQAYQRALQDQNAVDFNDLLNRVTTLFTEHEDIRLSWQSTFRHFMVDEVQDINRAQMLWLDGLTGGGRPFEMRDGVATSEHGDATHGMHEINTFRLRSFPRPTIAFVGDDDQAIYGFRGSDVAAMRALGDRFPGLETRFLRESYRCQPMILDVSNTLVANNTGRFGKTLIPADPDRPARPVEICRTPSPQHEIVQIARAAGRHIEEGGAPEQFAVLTRTRDLARFVARELRTHGLPVSEGKASDLRKTAEVKDAMAFAGFIVNPDAETLMRRIINKPSRGLGPTSLARIGANARLKGIGFLEELRSVIRGRIDLPYEAEPYKEAFVRDLKDFGRMVVEMRDIAARAPDAGAAMAGILERSGYLEDLRQKAARAAGVSRNALPGPDAGPDAGLQEFLMALMRRLPGRDPKDKTDLTELGMEDFLDRASQVSETARRLGNLSYLFASAAKQPTLVGFMQEATLEMEGAGVSAGIQVMTIHASKGLEFDHVRLPFWLDGILPHSNALQDGAHAVEEERRLGYVAITRARHSVTLSWPKSVAASPQIRVRQAAESGFLREITTQSPKSIRQIEVDTRHVARALHAPAVSGSAPAPRSGTSPDAFFAAVARHRAAAQARGNVPATRPSAPAPAPPPAEPSLDDPFAPPF